PAGGAAPEGKGRGNTRRAHPSGALRHRGRHRCPRPHHRYRQRCPPAAGRPAGGNPGPAGGYPQGVSGAGDGPSGAAGASPRHGGQPLALPPHHCAGSGSPGASRAGTSREGFLMPSWQAQVFNLGARLLIKSMMGFGSLGAVRGMAAVVDAAGERLAPPGCRLRAVTGAPFQGEWLEPLAGGSARVLLYFPGGAFVLRTPTQHREFVARLCLAADARALIVHYRLAPERPFPSGLEDCLAAYHHLLDIGVAPADITVAGDSAGGGLALSTLL